MFQIGAVAALEDHLAGFAADGFDTYVCSSSGATVGVALAAGRKVLDQLSSRLSEAGEEGGQRLQFAVRNITRGYDALEAEVKRLKEELAQARGQ